MQSRWPFAVLLALVLGGGILGLHKLRQHPALAADRGPERAAGPRLVVVLVFDQMRGDYLMKWKNVLGEGGFKRLMSEGAWFTNCHYPYAGTFTAPGHASLLTGCTPHDHGVVANEWFDRDERKMVGSVKPSKGDERNLSARRRRQPSVGDELMKKYPERSRVASLSIKDRSAILLAAFLAQICYWLSSTSGMFETSLNYRTQQHEWVSEFNAAKKIDKFVGTSWDRFRPDLEYARYSGPDDVEYEGFGAVLKLKDKTEIKQGRVFPHPTPNKEAVVNSPFGNELLLDLAKKAIRAEKLGQRDTPDLLCLSFSSNDLVGHCYGPDSQEVLDITLRSDLIVKELLDFLDKEVGKGQYAVALSADHGVGPIPELVQKGRARLGSYVKAKDAGYVPYSVFENQAEAFLRDKFGKMDAPWIETTEKGYLRDSTKIHLSQDLLKELKPEKIAEIEKALAAWLAAVPGVQAAFTRTQLLSDEQLKDPLAEMVRQSTTRESCAEVVAVLKPYYLPGEPLLSRKKGRSYVATHGSPHDYDTHVPLLAMGHGIRPGIYEDRVAPQAMAFVVAKFLQIDPPSGANPKFKPPEKIWEK